MMKRTLAILIFLCAAFAGRAQWLDSKVYDRPLKEVLTQIEQRYGVTLRYEDKNVKGRTVEKATWRFYAEVEATLDNVLRPLDMRWEKKKDGTYEIKKWEYFRKPFEEGQRHLELLSATFDTPAKLQARKAAWRANTMAVLGLQGLKKCDLRPVKSNLRKYDGYSVENVALEMLPGVWVCGSLYMPLKYKGQIPVMLCPHGHFYNAVDTSIPNERGRYRPDQQLRCATLARMGVAVFSYDMFAWGESAIAFNLKDHRTDLGLVMQTWQGIRALDWIGAQPWADASRVGITAASGGGTQTMLLAALDDRITLSVPVVMTSSHFFGGCPCESGLPIHFIPGQEDTNNAEIAGMAAPHPQLIVSDGHDWTQTVPQIEFPYLKSVYALCGAPDAVENAHFPKEGHDYGPSKRQAMYEFTARRFALKTSPDESRVTVEPAARMYVFGAERTLPEGAVTGAAALRKLLKDYRE